jgi:carbon monoxide dehydrogenase subunit G
MKLQGQFTFDGPREQVWDLLQDPGVLTSALPGTDELKQTEDGVYEGQMRAQVGPVNGLFDVKVTLKDRVPPERYTMVVDGKGHPGFVKGTVPVALEAQEDGTTRMTYDATLQVGGRLASVGQRLLDSVGKSLTRQGLEALDASLQARLAPGGEAEAPPAFGAPSQADFARGVVRDVVGDAAASPVTWVVTAALAGLLVGLLWGRQG